MGVEKVMARVVCYRDRLKVGLCHMVDPDCSCCDYQGDLSDSEFEEFKKDGVWFEHLHNGIRLKRGWK